MAGSHSEAMSPPDYQEGFPALAEMPAAGSHTCSRTNVGNTERWISAGAGAAIALLGLSRRGLGSLLALGAGAALIYRGVTGQCRAYEALGIDTAEHNSATAVPAQAGTRVEETITINCPPEKLYAFWRDVENLPKVMRHLDYVEAKDKQIMHWAAKGPLGITLRWDAEIINERENEMIAWRSLPGGDIDTAGSIHFRKLPHDRGTEVRVSIKYNPPGGKIGDAIAWLLGKNLEQEVEADLKNFKAAMEAGEIPTVIGQPRGG